MKYRIVLSDGSFVMLTDDPVFLSECIGVRIPAAGLLTGASQQWSTGAFLIETQLPSAEDGAAVDAADTDVEEAYWRKIIFRTKGLPYCIARTERLILRELSEEDAPNLDALYREVRNADAVLPQGGSGDALCDEGLDSEALAERLCAYRKEIYEVWNWGMWGVFTRSAAANSGFDETDRLIGRAGLERNADGRLELGYLIAPSQRRKGLAYEACCAVMEYVRAETGALAPKPEIESALEPEAEFEVLCRVRMDNPASAALAKKLQGSYPEVVVELVSI